jgi:hypothetical protein
LSLSLAGGAAPAAGAPVADALTHNAVVTHEITLGEEEIAVASVRQRGKAAQPDNHQPNMRCAI